MKIKFKAASRCLRISVTLCALFGLVAGCGGGGGGDDTPRNAAAGLTITRTQTTGTTQRAFESDGPQGLDQVAINADVTGDLARLNGQTVHVIVEDPEGLFLPSPQIILSGTGRGNTILLFPKPTSGRQGSYRQPLRINVCLDSQCQQPFNGSPLVVPVQIDVLPGLRLGTTSPVVIDAPFGPSNPEVTVPLTMPAEVVTWNATIQNPDMFSVISSQGGADLRLRMQAQPVGSYTQTVTVHAMALLDGRMFDLTATAPVTINVQPTAGVPAIWSPANVSLYTSAPSPDTYAWADVSLLAANGLRYTTVSRIEYLPASADGTISSASVDWLRAEAATAATSFQTRFLVRGSRCDRPDPSGFRCTAYGRYEALVYVRTADGVELPTPLRVTLTVGP